MANILSANHLSPKGIKECITNFAINKLKLFYKYKAKIIFNLDSDFIGTMPPELKSKHPNWCCVDFEEKTFVINNVFFIPVNGAKPQILRRATSKDSVENFIQIDLGFLGSDKVHFYVPAKHGEEIKHPNLYWFFNGSAPPVKIYSPK